MTAIIYQTNHKLWTGDWFRQKEHDGSDILGTWRGKDIITDENDNILAEIRHGFNIREGKALGLVAPYAVEIFSFLDESAGLNYPADFKGLYLIGEYGSQFEDIPEAIMTIQLLNRAVSAPCILLDTPHPESVPEWAVGYGENGKGSGREPLVIHNRILPDKIFGIR